MKILCKNCGVRFRPKYSLNLHYVKCTSCGRITNLRANNLIAALLIIIPVVSSCFVSIARSIINQIITLPVYLWLILVIVFALLVLVPIIRVITYTIYNTQK